MKEIIICECQNQKEKLSIVIHGLASLKRTSLGNTILSFSSVTHAIVLPMVVTHEYFLFECGDFS